MYRIDSTTHQVTYTPAAGYAGTDAFRFKVDDGKIGMAEAIVSLTVDAAPATYTVNGSAGADTIMVAQANGRLTITMFAGGMPSTTSTWRERHHHPERLDNVHRAGGRRPRE